MTVKLQSAKSGPFPVASLARGVALRYGDLDSAKRRKPAANRLGQVSVGPRGGGQSGAQDITRFFFHRASVVGGANPQAGLGFLVQLPNGECGHVSNDSIASIGCKEAPQRATSSPLSSPSPARPRRLRSGVKDRTPPSAGKPENGREAAPKGVVRN